jgi:hypothetical protein
VYVWSFFGSCVCSGVVRLEVSWFRACHSPEDTVLGRQIIRVAASLLTEKSDKKQKKLREHIYIQKEFQTKFKFRNLNSSYIVDVGVGESKQKKFLFLLGGLAT